MNSLITSASDVGRHRRNNEDSTMSTILDGPAGQPSLILLAVADGMGGAQGGEVASHTAIQTIHSEISSRWNGGQPAIESDWLNVLRESYCLCVGGLQNQVRMNSDLTGMGTTLTCLIAAGGKVYYAHIGDSRAYLLRDGKLLRLTTDHNAAQELADEGRIALAEVETHRSRHVLTRWLAADCAAPVPEVGSFDARSNDLYLLCSDGLYTAVPEDSIKESLGELGPEVAQSDLDRLAAQLIEKANSAGGRDNISVVLGFYR